MTCKLGGLELSPPFFSQEEKKANEEGQKQETQRGMCLEPDRTMPEAFATYRLFRSYELSHFF